MDVLGGSAIIRGENNLLAHAYFALPISITVEGANILTRNLMQFGQGLIKSHPYIYKQINALKNNNVESFDKAFFAHIGLVFTAFSKSLAIFEDIKNNPGIIICNSNLGSIKLVQNKYPEVKNFREATLEMVENLKEEMGDVVYRRSKFVVGEISRIQELVKSLEKNDFENE